MPFAIVTGASMGLGLSLSAGLVESGWEVVGTARGPRRLHEAADRLGPAFIPLSGDVSEPDHRQAIARQIDRHGGLHLLVNNASTLGESPMPLLSAIEPATLNHVFVVNAVAPLLLAQLVLGNLEAAGGVIVNVTSDAAVEAYKGWGGYGASKAALDHLSAVLGVENPSVPVYAFDPGDMRTEMHQAAFPGEDISDRPLPETVVPALLQLVTSRLPSGRYRAVDLLPVTA